MLSSGVLNLIGVQGAQATAAASYATPKAAKHWRARSAADPG